MQPGAPAGVGIDPNTGLFIWTPGEDQGPSTNSLVVLVTDDGSPPLTATSGFTVIVTAPNQAPVLTAIVDQTVVEETPLTVAVRATDPDGPLSQLLFSLDPARSLGLALIPPSRRSSGRQPRPKVRASTPSQCG